MAAKCTNFEIIKNKLSFIVKPKNKIEVQKCRIQMYLKNGHQFFKYKEAIAFSGDSMGHLQYILTKMQWLL